MPKLKTHRGVAKRVKISGNGKLIRRKAFHSHLLSGKSSKRKRRLRKADTVSPVDAQKIRRLLPYS
ncbi:MAG: 50S ribosomal protein L35 [Desulfobacterota bacterium]|nr:50S ribosomal protein L35 [Thermodesulfobacteriota bacterium]MDW8002003.1 50S ribosomal protein L35 [Deltaproteobacteria bacterium]